MGVIEGFEVEERVSVNSRFRKIFLKVGGKWRGGFWKNLEII